MPAPIDITGQTIGWLKVLKCTDERDGNSRLWECRCNACGGITYARAWDLRSGKKKSCGCKGKRVKQSGEEEREPRYDCNLLNEDCLCDGLIEMLCVTRGYCKFYKPRED